jgi:hypothetical protein
LEFQVEQFCLLTIRFSTAAFATFWFVTNRVPDTLQPVMRKQLVASAFV